MQPPPRSNLGYATSGLEHSRGLRSVVPQVIPTYRMIKEGGSKLKRERNRKEDAPLNPRYFGQVCLPVLPFVTECTPRFARTTDSSVACFPTEICLHGEGGVRVPVAPFASTGCATRRGWEGGRAGCDAACWCRGTGCAVTRRRNAGPSQDTGMLPRTSVSWPAVRRTRSRQQHCGCERLLCEPTPFTVCTSRPHLPGCAHSTSRQLRSTDCRSLSPFTEGSGPPSLA